MAAPEKHTVIITRAQLYPEVAHPGPAWRWTYDYTVDGGPLVLAPARDLDRPLHTPWSLS